GNRIAGEIVFLPESDDEPPQHDEGENGEDDETQDQPELLTRDGEDEVCVTVGQNALDRALARTLTEPAATHQRLQSHIHLIGVAFACEEPVDTFGHVRESHVGSERACGSEGAEYD